MPIAHLFMKEAKQPTERPQHANKDIEALSEVEVLRAQLEQTRTELAAARKLLVQWKKEHEPQAALPPVKPPAKPPARPAAPKLPTNTSSGVKLHGIPLDVLGRLIAEKLAVKAAIPSLNPDENIPL